MTAPGRAAAAGGEDGPSTLGTGRRARLRCRQRRPIPSPEAGEAIVIPLPAPQPGGPAARRAPAEPPDEGAPARADHTATHADLLETARRAVRAAVTADHGALRRELARLHGDLVGHIAAEHEVMAELPGAAPALVRDGADRLVALVADLLAALEGDSGDEDGDRTSYIAAMVEIDRTILRQTRLESALLARRSLVRGHPAGRARARRQAR